MLKMMKAAKKKVQLWCRNLFESAIYQVVRKRGLIKNPGKIVFVCTGNICRSAFAEKLMKAEINSPFLTIESCGLDVQVSSPSPVEAVRAANKIGLNLEDHLSRGFEYCDFECADLILAMELWQYRKLLKMFPHKLLEIKLLREFTPFPENLLCNINDPFGDSDVGFDKCFAQIRRSVPAIKLLINRAVA